MARRTYKRRSKSPARSVTRAAAAKTARAAKVSLSRSAAVAQTAQKALNLARRNKVRAFGSKQLKHEILPHNLFIYRERPACLCLTTPFADQYVVQCADNTTAGPPGLSDVLKFEKPSETAAEAVYNQWAQCNDDDINGEFKLNYSIYKFHLKATTSSASATFRIDFVRPYRATRTTTDANYQLPDSLTDWRYMLQDNQICPMKWKKVRKPLFMKLDRQDNTTQEEVFKTLYINHGHVKMNPIYHNPAVAKTSHSVDVPPSKQVWMVISTSQAQADAANKVDLHISRVVCWNDRAGHAA